MIFVGSRRRVIVHERINSVSGRLADTPVVASALSAKGKELFVATSRLDKMIDNILTRSGCTEYKLYLSGGKNFRYEIDHLYKANRPKEPIEWRQECHEHLIKKWGAIETDGYEADDAVGVEQKYDGSTIICGIDKDLLMIAGKHYQWPIVRGGHVVRQEAFLEVDPDEGMKTFFTQALTGDTTDNIFGIKGVGPVKASKILEECKTEEEMYQAVKEQYGEAEGLFHNNLDLLWIWRSYGETYTIRREVYNEI